MCSTAGFRGEPQETITAEMSTTRPAEISLFMGRCYCFQKNWKYKEKFMSDLLISEKPIQ
jgi:hypothetical protein